MTEVLSHQQASLPTNKVSQQVRPEKQKPLKRVYLAGPDLFHKTGVEIGIKKKAI